VYSGIGGIEGNLRGEDYISLMEKETKIINSGQDILYTAE
jgi:hypothetical protein